MRLDGPVAWSTWLGGGLCSQEVSRCDSRQLQKVKNQLKGGPPFRMDLGLHGGSFQVDALVLPVSEKKELELVEGAFLCFGSLCKLLFEGATTKPFFFHTKDRGRRGG